MAITAIGPTGTVDQAGFSQLQNLGDGMVGSLPGSSNLRVDRVVGQDRRVTVQPGWARVPGIRSYSSAVVTVDLPANAAGNPRLDWVVKRYLWNVSPATVAITYVQGTAAATPARPALVQTPGVQWDVPLGLVRVDAGVGALPPDAVFDPRYWDMDGIAAMAARTIDPPHRPGRELFVVGSRTLLVSDGAVWSPVNVTRTAGTVTSPAGWEPYGGGFLAPGFVYTSDGRVTLQGLIRRTNPAFTLDTGAYQVATVPVGYRPTATAMCTAATRVGICRLDVQANGAVVLHKDDGAVTFPSGTGYVSLDGVTYTTS